MKYKIIDRSKLVATVLADNLLKILFFPLRFRKKGQKLPDDIKEILIIRTAYLGDAVMTMPILKPLKQKYPKARITLLASAAASALLANNKRIDRFLSFEPFWFYRSSIAEYFRFIRAARKERFDLIIEARGDIRDILLLAFPIRSRFKLSYDFGGGGCLLTHAIPFTSVKHRVEYHLDLVSAIGCSADTIEWGLTLDPEEEREAEAILNERGIVRPFIAAHPGSRLPLKRWPAEKCALLYDRLIKQHGMQVVILGSQEESELTDEIVGLMTQPPVNLAGALDIRQLACVISKASLLVCNDSAPMHIAVALGTPAAAVFGPSKPEETRPFADNCRVVARQMPCRWTCNERRCAHTVYNQCMREISVDEVLEAASDIIREARPSADSVG